MGSYVAQVCDVYCRTTGVRWAKKIHEIGGFPMVSEGGHSIRKGGSVSGIRDSVAEAMQWLCCMLAEMLREMNRSFNLAVEFCNQGLDEQAEDMLSLAIACERAIDGIQFSIRSFASH